MCERDLAALHPSSHRSAQTETHMAVKQPRTELTSQAQKGQSAVWRDRKHVAKNMCILFLLNRLISATWKTKAERAECSESTTQLSHTFSLSVTNEQLDHRCQINLTPVQQVSAHPHPQDLCCCCVHLQTLYILLLLRSSANTVYTRHIPYHVDAIHCLLPHKVLATNDPWTLFMLVCGLCFVTRFQKIIPMSGFVWDCFQIL